jgi:hypothetical protein
MALAVDTLVELAGLWAGGASAKAAPKDRKAAERR